jgi:hypothetical protein
LLRKGCGPERRPAEDNGELHDWLSLQNIIRVMKTRMMMLGAGACSMCVGEEQCIQSFGGEICRKGTFEKLDVRCGILFKLILIEWV